MAEYNNKKTEHAFKTFAGDLKEGIDWPVIYMYGEEDYLIDWAVSTIADKYISGSFASADLERPDPESVTMDEIIRSCETVSMFSPRRIIWVKEYPPLWQDNVKGFGDRPLKELEDYLETPNPGTILIFTTSRVKNDPRDKKEKKSKLNKLLLSKAHCYNFCRLERPALTAFIEKRFRTKGLTSDRNTVDYLIEMSGYYHRDSDYRLMNLDRDMNKIVSLADGKVRREDVDRAVMGDMDTYVFDLLDHLSVNRKDEAFAVLHNIVSSGSDIFSVLGLMIRHFELLTEVSELRDRGMDISGIVREMGVHEFRVKKAMRASDRFGTEKLKEVLSSLYETDINIKQGNIDGLTSLELLIGRI